MIIKGGVQIETVCYLMVYLLFKARHLEWLDAHVHKLSIVLAAVVSHSALLSLGDSPNYLFCM